MKTPFLMIDVDTQQDFCSPQGALFVAGAPKVMPNIKALIELGASPENLLVSSVDTHDFAAWEFQDNGGPFPPHCVKGTPGWLKVQGTLPSRTLFVPQGAASSAPALPEGVQGVVFEKEVYSLFANPRAEPVLDDLLNQRGLGRADVQAVVFGVATDYCVKAAALGLRGRGYEVAVVTDAIAAVSAEAGQIALNEMQAAGCTLVTTESLT